MMPLLIPKASSSTLAIGARQLVVHDALDTSWASGVRSASLTPSTTVASIGSLDGTVRTTRLAPAARCLLSASRGAEDAGRLDDDFDAEIGPRQLGRVALLEHLHGVPAGAHHAICTTISPGNRPNTVSYLSR